MCISRGSLYIFHSADDLLDSSIAQFGQIGEQLTLYYLYSKERDNTIYMFVRHMHICFDKK